MSSNLAQQIISDKPDYWEYKLTAEFLRASLQPIRERLSALERGLYALPTTRISRLEATGWLSDVTGEAVAQTEALSGLFNGELQASWGPAGSPGSEHDIRRVCDLIAEACKRMLNWEERVRFISIDEPYEEFPKLLRGTCGRNLSKVCEVPTWIDSIFESDPPAGQHELNLVFDLPEGWVERITDTIRQAQLRMHDYI